MLVRYTLFFWKDLFNYPRHRARWPSPYKQVQFKKQMLLSSAELIKKTNVYDTYKCLNHAKLSLLLMKQLCEKIVLWKGLMFFTCLDLHIPKRQEGLKEAFPKQTVCHKKLFPTLHDLLGNSLTGAVVSYKIQNEKTVTAKWSLWNCHPFHINCI